MKEERQCQWAEKRSLRTAADVASQAHDDVANQKRQVIQLWVRKARRSQIKNDVTTERNSFFGRL
jgi:hypothetical protein